MASAKTLFNFTTLSRDEKAHLNRVYSMLAILVFSAFMGFWVHIHLFQLPLLPAMILLSIAAFNIPTRDQRVTRKQLFCALLVPFVLAMMSGDWIYAVYRVYPDIILISSFGSLAIFASFSLGALFAERRKYFFLGAALSSLSSMLTLFSLGRHLFGYHYTPSILTWTYLLLYIGFVVYDTQVTIESYRLGNKDYVSHAFALFLDLYLIFQKVIDIMVMNREDEANRRRKRA